MNLQLLRLLELLPKRSCLFVIATHTRFHLASRGSFCPLRIEIAKSLILQHNIYSLLEVILTF